MSYATVAHLRAELKNQVTVGAATDAELQRKLDAATAIIDSEIGFSIVVANAPSTQIVLGDGTIYLQPSRFVPGSVTAVSSSASVTIPDYIEQDGSLVVADASGAVPLQWDSLQRIYGTLESLRWQPGVPYTVHATFGYAAIPADLQEACLQIAVRMWRGRDAGYSDVVGVEGSGAVGYNGALPAMVKRILATYRQTSWGVW